jgi:FkbM family methyltransferase
MTDQRSRVPFVLASTEHGTMILNRLDQCTSANATFGVGYDLLETGAYEPSECSLMLRLLQHRRQHYGDGVIMLDGGANIGTHTVLMARAMSDWGQVVAVEPQERIYYALCGNIALNNCFNAWAVHAALGNENVSLVMPGVDYQRPASYGSLELRPRTQNIGQDLDLSTNALDEVVSRTVDSFDFDRLDLMKLDIEGMELQALEGARHTIGDCLPIIFAECLKVPADEIGKFLLPFGYRYRLFTRNLVAVHETDPTLKELEV